MKEENESIYSKIGGEQGLQIFVDALYDAMDNLPEVAQVRDMHPADLSYARERLFMFLSGMLGGPPLYMEAFGHPRLRRKHLHFSIGNEERDQWMKCAQRAADKLAVNGQAIDVSTKQALLAQLAAMADHLRNKSDRSTCSASANALKHTVKVLSPGDSAGQAFTGAASELCQS